MPWSFTGYYSTDTDITAAQRDAAGSGSWTINSDASPSTISISDGRDPMELAGDGVFDSPTDPTQTHEGNFILYEVIREFTGSDGNLYTAVIFEYDADGSGAINLTSGLPIEQTYFIAFIPNGFDASNITPASLGNGGGGLPAGTVPPPGTMLTFTGTTLANSDAMSSVCISSQNCILTPMGDKPIGAIKAGDIVDTADGPKIVRWKGSVKITSEDMRRNPKLRPVRITAGAMGVGLPMRDLVVSRQHRMLVSSKIVKRMTGENEALVSAIKLTQMPGIFVDEDIAEIEYVHLLFDAHEVIFSEGAPTESLYSGPEAMKTVSAEARDEILTLFPEFSERDYQSNPARLIMPGKKGQKLVVRHNRNRKALIGGYSRA